MELGGNSKIGKTSRKSDGSETEFMNFFVIFKNNNVLHSVSHETLRDGGSVNRHQWVTDIYLLFDIENVNTIAEISVWTDPGLLRVKDLG